MKRLLAEEEAEPAEHAEEPFVVSGLMRKSCGQVLSWCLESPCDPPKEMVGHYPKSWLTMDPFFYLRGHEESRYQFEFLFFWRLEF